MSDTPKPTIVCLKLIESEGGKTVMGVDGILHCNGSWCAEQARRALEECG